MKISEVNRKNEIVNLFQKGISTEDIYNQLKEKYCLNSKYQISNTITRFLYPVNKCGKYNSNYKSVDLEKLKQFVFSGYGWRELKSEFNVGRWTIVKRCKDLNIYNILKTNSKNKGIHNGKYLKIPELELTQIIKSIEENNLFTIKDISYGSIIYKKLKEIGRYDVVEKLKKNIRNYRLYYWRFQNPNYKGGITKKLYNQREQILCRQNYKCKICSGDITQKNYEHHLDCNHFNNIIKNRVYLCSRCHNKIHQRGYNFHSNTWKLYVYEIFFSLQGEGRTSGYPTLFWRNSLCNLFCTFCDSKYSWKRHSCFDMSKVVNKLQEWKSKTGSNRLCITGGEPFYQNIEPLIMIAKCLDFYIEVETNGTVMPCEFAKYIDFFNVSLKLSNNGVEKDKRIISKVINYYVQQSNVNFKFVVGNDTDVQEVFEIVNEHKINVEQVLLMPLTTYNEVKDKQIRKKVWQYCVKNNIKYSPRLHYEIFGQKRGI